MQEEEYAEFVGTPEEAENFLNANIELAKSWILKHVPRKTLEAWVAEKRLTVRGSEAMTIHMREKEGTVGGNIFEQFVRGTSCKRGSCVRKTKVELLKMSHKDMFMELIRDIASELDVNVLCHKILVNVITLISGDRGSLFLVRGTDENKYLISKLFDVTEESNLEDTLHTEDNHITVAFGSGIVGSVALTKTLINIKDAYQDPRFNKIVDKKTGYHTKSILCLPILDHEDEVVGVAQIMNKMIGGIPAVFTGEDEQIFRDYLTFAGIGLTNAQLFEMSVGEFKQNKLLLNLAEGMSGDHTSLDKLIQRIMIDAQDLIKCARCNVHVFDSSRSEQEAEFKKCFELHSDNPANIIIPSVQHIQAGKSFKFAKQVAQSRQVLILDKDPKIREEYTEKDGFVMKSLLSIPIFDGEKMVIGVIQMMNKLNGKPFAENDRNSLETLSIFCGLGMHNCQLHKNRERLVVQHKVTFESLLFHSSPFASDVDDLFTSELKTPNDYRLFNFDFVDANFDDFYRCQVVLKMFLEIDVIDKFNLSTETLCRWIMAVKMNYRPIACHDWRRAVLTMQTLFVMFTRGNVAQYFDDLEIFAILVAALCHNLDHLGASNATLVKSGATVAELYDSTPLQYHHFSFFHIVLQLEGTDIFGNLSLKDKQRAYAIIQRSIIESDYLTFHKKMELFTTYVSGGEKKWTDPSAKELLRSVLFMAAMMSIVCKPPNLSRHELYVLAAEVLQQCENFTNPRLSADEQVARMQQLVHFVDWFCIPLYSNLVQVQMELSPLLRLVTSNNTHWKTTLQDYAKQHEARAGETASKDRYPQQLQFSTVSASSSTPEPHQKAPE